MKRKRIEYDSPVKVSLTLRQRKLILDHTFADDELTNRLKIATVEGTRIAVGYTLDELDALHGYVAAEANHCKDRKLQKELDTLFVKLMKTLESYDDGEWPDGS